VSRQQLDLGMSLTFSQEWLLLFGVQFKQNDKMREFIHGV
jgi:hypothetical protein